MSKHIRAFDAHIYYSEETRSTAAELHAKAIRDFTDPTFRISTLIERKVGPHPMPMFEIQFTTASLSDVIQWLLANREGLTVLVHSVTGDDPKDHHHGALWMGQMLKLDMSKLDPSP
jgi:aromatic ring-cleaving dioxygenase